MALELFSPLTALSSVRHYCPGRSPMQAIKPSVTGLEGHCPFVHIAFLWSSGRKSAAPNGSLQSCYSLIIVTYATLFCRLCEDAVVRVAVVIDIDRATVLPRLESCSNNDFLKTINSDSNLVRLASLEGLHAVNLDV